MSVAENIAANEEMHVASTLILQHRQNRIFAGIWASFLWDDSVIAVLK